MQRVDPKTLKKNLKKIAQNWPVSYKLIDAKSRYSLRNCQASFLASKYEFQKSLILHSNFLKINFMSLLQKELELAHYTARNVKEKISAIRNEISVIESKMQNVTYDEKCLLDGANVICTTLNSCCTLSRYERI